MHQNNYVYMYGNFIVTLKTTIWLMYSTMSSYLLKKSKLRNDIYPLLRFYLFIHGLSFTPK